MQRVIHHNLYSAVVGIVIVLCSSAAAQQTNDRALRPMTFNNPGLHVKLGVRLLSDPLVFDADGDGHLDLYVACRDKPSSGVYRFDRVDDKPGTMLFHAGVRVADSVRDLQVSQRHDGRWVVTARGRIYPNFVTEGLANPVDIGVEPTFHTDRFTTWRYFDYDGDGVDDLVVGTDDWSEYGWDDAYNDQGEWTNGPVRGFVWWIRNIGSNDEPKYAEPQQVMAGDAPVETYGYSSPNFADFNGDGLPDLICGSFLDDFTWFENIGTRTAPKYAPGRKLMQDGQIIRMNLQIIVPMAADWDEDGHIDLIVGEEDGHVSLLRNSGQVVDGMPQFELPQYFMQEADGLKADLLCTPSAVDWNGDGKVDLLCGNSAGYLDYLENLGGNPPRWAAPVKLEAGGKVFRIMAGPNGSIQGPAEAKWGYTMACAADWNMDGLPDVIVNNIWGKILWLENIGTRTQPKLAAAQAVTVQWNGEPARPPWINWWKPQDGNLVTQWRSSVQAIDLTGDGLLDLVALDEDGYLAMYERQKVDGQLQLLPPKRIFHVAPGEPNVYGPSHRPVSFDLNNDGVNDLAVLDDEGCLRFFYQQVTMNSRTGDAPNRSVDRSHDPRYQNESYRTALRMNGGWAGRSGRRKFVLTDWDHDGKLDLLADSVNVSFLKNVAEKPGEFVFQNMGPVDEYPLAGHSTCPTVADLDGDGKQDLIIGAENGFLYFLSNPY